LAGDGDAVRTIARNPDWTAIVGTDKPWLYTYALSGPLSFRIRLGPEGAPPRRYRVVLHFCEFEGAPSGGRISVTGQGPPVLSRIAAREQTGGANRALVREVLTDAGAVMKVELLPDTRTALPISGIELFMQ